MSGEWIDAQKELPPKDGIYEVTNNENNPISEACLYYDGIGFLYLGIYRPIMFWRFHSEIKKRYGKMIFLSKEAEENFANASEGELNAISQLLSQNIRDSQMKINAEMEKVSNLSNDNLKKNNVDKP
jgi:hypothetical protein